MKAGGRRIGDPRRDQEEQENENMNLRTFSGKS